MSCSTAEIAERPGVAAGTDATKAFEIALHDGDLTFVQRVAADNRRPRAEAALADAALDYWRRLDDQAGDALSRATNDLTLSQGLRRSALLLLSGLRMRQSRYSEAVATLDAALPLISDESERAETQEARDTEVVLVGAPPMRAVISGPGSVPLTRDRAGLTRGPVAINGATLDTIIDTGSSVCTITESNARRLGLHILPGQVSIGTATSSHASGGLAVADSVAFGGAEFHNVVFLMLPDNALTFANGAYVVQAIVGMPILLELGRIEYRTDGGKETLTYARTGGRPAANSNLIVESDEPYTFVKIDGSERVLRLFIDNGATTTHLNQRFAAEFPAFVASAYRESVTRTGAAGSETQDAMKLPSLVLRIGRTTAPITHIDVIDDQKTNRHGDLGLDALRTAPGYVLDFEAMRFELLSRDRVSGQ
jgi:predicted aspartyl protease